MRIIDADALKRHYSWWKGGTREMTMDEAKNDFDTIIDLQPTIEPKHGRWDNKVIYSDNKVALWCSECGKRFFKLPTENGEYNYCPNCGSRNEVEE